MRGLLVLLGAVACLAVAIRTVSLRVEIVREGYARARLEERIREERELVRCLEAEIAASLAPATLRANGERLGVVLAERDPDQIVRASRPAFVETQPRALARR